MEGLLRQVVYFCVHSRADVAGGETAIVRLQPDVGRLDYLDLGGPPRLRRRPPGWREEEAFLQGSLPVLALLPRERGFRERCTSCPYIFDQRNPRWSDVDPGTRLEGRQAVRSVTSFVFHGPKNRATVSRLLPVSLTEKGGRPISAGSSARMSPKEREELGATLKLVYQYWGKNLCLPEPAEYGRRILELGKHSAEGEAAFGFLPTHLLPLATGAAEYDEPPELASLLKKTSRSKEKCERLKATFLGLLRWAADALGTSVKERRLGQEEFRARQQLLQLAIDKCVAASFLQSEDGAVTVSSNCQTEKTFPDVCRCFLECSYRNCLLQRLADLPTLESEQDTYLHPDGTNLLSPTFARDFLFTELYLLEGATPLALGACTLGEFLGRTDESNRASSETAQQHAAYSWTTGSGHRLHADGSLVLAIDGYVEALRGRLLKTDPSTGEKVAPQSAADLAAPLFPASGEGPLANLEAPCRVLCKLGGGASARWLLGVGPDMLHGLKESWSNR